MPRDLKGSLVNSGRRPNHGCFPKRQRAGALQDLADIPLLQDKGSALDFGSHKKRRFPAGSEGIVRLLGISGETPLLLCFKTLLGWIKKGDRTIVRSPEIRERMFREG